MDETMNTNAQTDPVTEPAPTDLPEQENTGEDTVSKKASELTEQAEIAAPQEEQEPVVTEETSESRYSSENDISPAESATDATEGAENTNVSSSADTLTEVLMQFCDMARKDMTEREEAALAQGMERIRALDPSVTSAGDLFAMEENEAFYDMVVNRGLSWDEAYKTVCFDRLMQRAQASGAQAERNRQHARAHLERTRSRGTPADSVPPEIMAIYRAMNPQASEAEIVRHYNHTK